MLVDELAAKVSRANEHGEADERAGRKEKPYRVAASVSAKPKSKGREDSKEPKAPQSPCPMIVHDGMCHTGDEHGGGRATSRDVRRHECHGTSEIHARNERSERCRSPNHDPGALNHDRRDKQANRKVNQERMRVRCPLGKEAHGSAAGYRATRGETWGQDSRASIALTGVSSV